MTETRRRRTVPVGWYALAAFLTVLAALAIQLREGRDPSLGAAAGSSAPVAPRRVLIRRVIRRTIVVHVIPAPSSAPAPAAGSPTITSSPVVTAGPPPPAPVPAPVTRTS